MTMVKAEAATEIKVFDAYFQIVLPCTKNTARKHNKIKDTIVMSKFIAKSSLILLFETNIFSACNTFQANRLVIVYSQFFTENIRPRATVYRCSLVCVCICMFQVGSALQKQITFKRLRG